MFKQIEAVSDKWVNEQIKILSDSQILIANINSGLGEALKEFIEKLTSLDLEKRNSFCKDHVFHNWLNEIKIELINAYESKDLQINNEKLFSIFNLLNFSISVLNKTDIRFKLSSLPASKVLLPTAGLFLEFTNTLNDNDIKECIYLPKTSQLEIAEIKTKLVSFPHVESINIVNDNFDFFLDPTGDKYSIDFDDCINTSEWIKTLEEALTIIKADDTSYKLVRNFVSYLVPLKQKEVIKNLSFSVRNLPNVIFKSNELTPYLIGETLVHEADHQFFYAIEKFQNFWTSDVQLQEAIYFSPWRDDPRPLDGILRGLSSFARVSKYYSTVLKTFNFSQQQIESVGTMLLTRLSESQIAFDTISNSKQLSEFGIEYLNEIQETLNEAEESAKSHNEYEKWRRNAMKVIEAHKINWKIINQKNEYEH